MNNFKTAQCFCYLSSLIFGKILWADELGEPKQYERPEIRKKPVSFSLLGTKALTFTPLLEVSEAYNDNIFANNILKKGSFVNQIHAGGELALTKQQDRYALTYSLQSTLFASSPVDNYVDNYVGIDTYTEFDSRNRLKTNIYYLDSHYFRGYFFNRDLYSVPMKTTPDTYHRYSAFTTYRYGGENARGNLELKAGVDDYTFDNNFASTSYQDRTAYDITPGFFVKVAPKTRVLAQVENTINTYKNPQWFEYGYVKQRYLTGVTFDYTEFLRGQVRGGYLQQSYNASNIKNIEGFTWDVNLLWYPTSYSKIEFGASRDIKQLIGNAIARESERYHIGWMHDWSSRINTKIFAGMENGTYQSYDGSVVSRVDNYHIYGADINYSYNKWLGFSLSYTGRNLDSSFNVVNFDQNTFMFYITANPRIADDIKLPWASWY